MNIKTNEILLLDRKYNNMKFGALKEQPAEPQTTASNPQEIMNAMNLQAKNNMAFQGLKFQNLSKLPKVLVTAGMLAAAGIGSTSMTSCVKQEQYTYVDMTAINAMKEEFLNLFHQMIDGQTANNNLMQQFMSQWSSFMSMYQEGLISADEFYQRMYQWMQTNEEWQAAILAQAQANGYTQEEIRDILSNIEARLAAGEITYAQAMAEILSLLRNIDATLTSLLNEFVDFKAQYLVDRDTAFAMIGRIERNGEIQVDNSNDIKNAVNALRTDVQGLNLTVSQINNNLQDTNYHPTREQYQTWIDQLGINITNAAQMSEDSLRAEIRNFLNRYIATEQTQTNLLTNIANNTNYLQYFPTATEQQNQTDSIIAAINAFRTAWANGQGQGQGGQGSNVDYTQQLQDIYNAILALKTSVDGMAGTLNTHVSNFQTFYNNWQTANATVQQRLLDQNTLQQDANAYLANLQAGQNILVNRTGSMVNTEQHISDVLDSLAARGRDGMTFAEFSNFMQNQYGPQQYQNLLTWYASTGLADLPANVLRIADASEHIDNDIHNLNRLPAQLDTVISMLRGANWDVILQTPGKLDAIMEILNGFDFCGCQNGNGNNEGRIDDLGDELQ